MTYDPLDDEPRRRRKRRKRAEGPSLFDVPPFEPHKLARADDLATSKAAAAQAKELSGKHQQLIVQFLRGQEGGWTKDEIASGVGIDAVAVARRMRGLADAGLVEEAGTGRSPAGRPSTKWRAL